MSIGDSLMIVTLIAYFAFEIGLHAGERYGGSLERV
jgi:hypothetical protein